MLYEVITAVVDPGAEPAVARFGLAAFVASLNRQTSKEFVITSYSIHYTKLYDRFPTTRCPRDANETGRNRDKTEEKGKRPE